MLHSKYAHFFRLLRNERRSRQAIKDIQNDKFKRLIDHAYRHVPFYRELFRRHGIHSDDIKSIDDIGKIPLITKQDFHLREPSYYQDQRSDPAQCLPVFTSGSSGLSLLFLIDKQYDQIRKAQYLRPYYTNGQRPTDKVVRISRYSAPPRKWFQKLGIFDETRILSDSNLDRQLQIIQELKPQVLYGYGSCLSLLAAKILEENISLPAPRLLFTDSELLTSQMRQVIERGFRGSVIDIYGTFETDNIAYECNRHQGYHIAEDSVVMEFVQDGKPVGPGESGEIVCTVLDNFMTPFIRYNLRDVGKYKQTPCSCGRTFPLMEMIEGRVDDFALCENGQVKSPHVFLGMFAAFSESLHEFQVIQEDVRHFSVNIVPRRAFNGREQAAIRKGFRKEFPEAHIEIRIVSSIEREQSGKFRVFKSLVHKG